MEDYRVEFNQDKANQILIELDGWILVTQEEFEESKKKLNDKAFMDDSDLSNLDKNHVVTYEELEHFYNSGFYESLVYTSRYNLHDLEDSLVDLYLTGVYKLTAGNIWMKYNTSVTVDNEEGSIDYGQGGKLYKKATGILDRFIKSELYGLTKLTPHIPEPEPPTPPEPEPEPMLGFRIRQDKGDLIAMYKKEEDMDKIILDLDQKTGELTVYSTVASHAYMDSNGDLILVEETED